MKRWFLYTSFKKLSSFTQTHEIKLSGTRLQKIQCRFFFNTEYEQEFRQTTQLYTSWQHL